MSSTLFETQSRNIAQQEINSHAASELSSSLFDCNCMNKIALEQQDLEQQYYSNMSSASYENHISSQQIVHKHTQPPNLHNINNNHIHSNHSEHAAAQSICIVHSDDIEIMQKMERDLLINDEYKKKFLQETRQRAQQNQRPVCGKSLKDVISYHCLDCFEDKKAIICEDCFQLSDHLGHRYYFQRENSGICDCGDQEVFCQDAKVGCKLHKGNMHNEEVDMSQLDQQFLQRLQKQVPIWFKKIFELVELYLIKGQPQNLSEYQNKIVKCVFKVIQSLEYKNDNILAKAISDILIKHGNNYQLYHDCQDYQNQIPSGENLVRQSCNCSILELICRFAMPPCFLHETQGIIRQSLVDLLIVSSYKVGYAQAFIKMFNFLYDIDLNTKPQQFQAYSNNLICLTRQEVFNSYTLNHAVYQTGQAKQIFLHYKKIASFFQINKTDGDQNNKILPYQLFYYHYVNIQSLISKMQLFEKFLQEPELFDILLSTHYDLQEILQYDQKIFMPEQNFIGKNTYLLYYRMTGQLNLFKIIANNFAARLNEKEYHDILINYIQNTLTCINQFYSNKNQNEIRKSTYFPLERDFIYLFFAYFSFDLSKINQENLSKLSASLNLSYQQMKTTLLQILSCVLQSIGIFQEVNNKMWVFNGDDFESHIKQYCNTEFEIKVVDSMCVKIITKLYSFSDILSYFPQNPFSESLVQFRQKELMEEYAAKENTIYENAQNMISKSFISFSSYLNFICYNVCSELDEIYFSCIQQCQNQTEIKEEIIIQSTTYFATLINGLNKTVNDIKSLGELYQKDLGKKAPVQDMCLKVSKCDQNTVQILKEYANIYEPYNFIFNQDAQSKYYGAIEANTNQSDKFAMILGNVFLKNENYLKIGENTVNHSLLSYILKFIKHEYNLPILQEQLQIREMILYSTLKLITIFVQVQKYTQENNDILEQLFNQFQIVMPDAQFKGIIQHVYTLKQNYSKHGCEYEAQINAKGFQEQNLTTSTQPEQKPEQKKEDQSEQRKRMLQRQQEVLKQMQSQQNKFKQLNVENASNQMQIEEECCFCKQPLTQSAYGVLVSIQKNTFYAEQEIKTLLRNLEQSKNDNLKSQQEELKQICLSEQRANGDMFVFSTCDHKIHKECYEQNINNIQLNQYEQASKDFEVKCQICKQYRNFFLEINHPTGFEDEKFENKAENANQNNGMPMMMEFNLGQDGFNDFDAGFNNFGANSMYNQGSSYNNYDFGGNLFGNNDNGMMGNNAFSMEPTNLSFDFNPSNNSNQMQLSKEEGDDDGEVKEIIYKKVKKNNSEAQFKESQQHSIQRIGKIYSMMQREKNGVSELRDILNQSLIQQQKQPPQADQQEIMRQKQFQESMLALSIFDKYIKVNDERQSQSTFNFSQIMQEPFDQFLFYEKCLYNQIRYFDLANKKPDDDTSLLKVSNFLLQCYLNSFSFINDSNKRQDIVQKRFKYCQQFDELLHKGIVAKYDDTLFKDLPYILKKEYLENNIPDAYTSYLIFKLGFQFNANSEKIVQTSLPQVLEKFSLQIIRSQNLLAQSADKFSIDNEDNVDIIENYLLRLSRRSLITTILFKKYTEQNQTFNKIFASSSMYDAENSVILKYFNLSMKDYLPTQAEIDSLECTQKINKNQQSKILPLLLITEAHNFCFDLIPIPDDYLAYSKTLHMKKCSLCNKIPLITDLMQCLICGDLCCAQSCTQTVQRTAGSLNRHANICHGGQAIFVNTQSGYISVISSPHNTILVSTFIFQNSLKQPIRKQIRCDWKQFLLNKSLIQNLKKQLFENNTRNLVLEDHQQRIEKNIKPFIINPRIL